MSNISIAEASRQLSQVINRATYGREVVVLTSRGRPKAVLVGVEVFQALLGIQPSSQSESVEEFARQFRQALQDTGHSTPDEIIEMVRDVKREISDELAG
jgi:prevent-host-death family protein